MGMLDSKVAFITGAARGIGRATAVRLAEEGASVLGIDICEQIASAPYAMGSADDLAETVSLVEAAGGRMIGLPADVRDYSAVESSVARGLDELGRIDIVFANAGIAIPDPEAVLWNIDLERWRDVIDVNVTGVWHTVRAAVPSMIERGEGGSVVITSSTGGIKGMATNGDYVTSKHGVVGLMRTLAKEVAEYSIRVNTVHPTGVRTYMNENPHAVAYYEKLGAAAQAAQLQNLLPVELTEPVDIANAVAWLSSDQARYVTGVSLPVDAGLTQR